MKHPYALSSIALAFIILACSNPRQPDAIRYHVMTDPFENTLLLWNQATMASMDRQAKLEKDTFSASSYASSYLHSQVNNNTARREFLSVLFEEKLLVGEVVVLEAFYSGEQVQMFDYLFYSKGDSLFMNVYERVPEGWLKNIDSMGISFTFARDFNEYRVAMNSGHYGKVTLTRFKDQTVESSEFFINATLTKERGIEDILHMRRPR